MPGERKLCIVADDLSGAADCAAGFTAAFGAIAVLLGGVAPGSGNVAVDTDSRAMEGGEATSAVGNAFARIPPSVDDGLLVYKKIDSTLRGHVAAELRAALDTAPRFAGAVVAPSFPEQGRTLKGGRLCLQGRQVEETAGDLMALLEGAALRPALLQQLSMDPLAIRQVIAQAIADGARVVVVDAANRDDLARLAEASLFPVSAPWLLAGSAGLARALARRIGAVGDPGHAKAFTGGPVLALVGSFSPASASQLRQVESSGTALVIRLDGSQWLSGAGASDATGRARTALRGGHHVVLAISGAVVQPFSRELVQGMARAAAALLPDAGTCVLTGGDTARALFDQLGVNRLEVVGEFEPGISLARIAAAGAPGFVLKAGGFGDAGTLQRIIGYFGGLRRAGSARDTAPS